MCYMTSITHREMRNNSAEVLKRVENGETITVTNHGQPVARMSPVEASSVLEELEAKGQVRRATGSVAELRSIKRVTLPDGVTTADIIADVRGYERGY